MKSGSAQIKFKKLKLEAGQFRIQLGHARRERAQEVTKTVSEGRPASVSVVAMSKTLKKCLANLRRRRQKRGLVH